MKPCNCNTMGLEHEPWCDIFKHDLTPNATEIKAPKPKYYRHDVVLTPNSIEVIILESKWDDKRMTYVYYLQEKNFPNNKGWCLENELKPKRVLLHD